MSFFRKNKNHPSFTYKIIDFCNKEKVYTLINEITGLEIKKSQDEVDALFKEQYDSRELKYDAIRRNNKKN